MSKRTSHQNKWDTSSAPTQTYAPLSPEELTRRGYGLPDPSLSNIELARSGEMLLGKVAMTRTGLRITEDPTREEWGQIGDVIFSLGKSIQWIIGDYLAYSDQWEYGVTYERVAELTGYEVVSLRDMAYVCTNVNLSLRNDKLKFGHHKAVAHLAPHEQVEWLNKAELGKWSISKLREEVKRALEGDPPTPPTARELLLNHIQASNAEALKLIAKTMSNPAARDEAMHMIDEQMHFLQTLRERLEG